MRPFDPALVRSLPATRWPVARLAAVGVLSGVVAIAQALLLALVVGRVVSGGPLGPVLGWLVGVLVLRGVLAGVSERVARRAGQRVAGEVRAATLRSWLGRPVERRPADEVAVTRATEGVSAVEPYVGRYLPALVTAAVVPALTVVALLVVDPWSALVVVLTLPLLPVFAALIGRHTQDQTERRWGAMSLLAGHFLDVVRGLPTLVAYGRARAQVDVVRAVGERHREATVRTLRTAFLSTAALELLATISVAMVAVAVGLRLAYGAMDLVVGLAAILLAPEAYWPVRRVGAEFHNAADGATTLEALRADGVLGGEPAHADEPARAGVVLRDVSYAHPGRGRTVAGVTLTTPSTPGLTVLTGPSGAGKTTVLELLAGLRVPASGTVVAPPAHLAAQRPLILPGSVRDNLALAGGSLDVDGSAADAAMVAALDRVGLWAALADREGLGTVLGDEGFGLSAGQRTRLALARALLSDAPLLLLDEPTANVAASSVPLLHEVIRGLAAGRRVVVVTHDPALAALADDRWELTPLPLQDPRAVLSCHGRRQGDRRDTTEPSQDAEAPAGQTAVPGHVEPIATPGGRHGLWLACALGGASVACGVALTATSGWLIVQASTMPVILTLMVAIVGVRAFGLFRPVFRYAERVVSHDVALEDLAGRRADVFARLVPLTPARLGRRSRGEVLTAVVRDLDDVVDEQVRVTVPAWSALVASVTGAALAAWHLPAAGAVVAGGALLTLGLAASGYAAERAAQQDAVESRGQLQHRVTALTGRLLAVQAVTGLHADRTVLLAGVARAEQAQQRAEARLVTARAVVLALVWCVVAGTTALVAVLVREAHAAGGLGGPSAALVALVPMALADTWVGAADVAGARARARAAAARLAAVLGQSPAVRGHGTQEPAATDVPTLTLDGVGASWEARGSLDLAPLDLDLAPGSRVALAGPNGAGKSTALAVLARHLDPLCGRYALDRADVLDLELERTRARIAVVDDEPHAFAGSVRANLVLARQDATDEEVVAALRAVDLGHWYATLPQGLDTLLTGLSGGERSRLSLARAVLSGRPVVLLDEPAAHLDDATAERALGGLLSAPGADRRTHVMVSHRPGDLSGWRTTGLHAERRTTGAATVPVP
ncbi:thiol reductant ABC exporter subunit CydD [Ornithinimicrobium pekingense]|uniref:Glutathione/cysteine ABC transporter permease/ATPase n=1 Tax=Ornithinimicrobium pekingense TaxID=384677 RepID=A0ABQ2F465_9MICO|nr:thiol reductant ABC exporter subunit CydD [Ornithinimicrobium pekingense]GGK56800.1 glutathione/cysteine ABC transporter permease/ATPase [Ornithinimicrobium pekingense]